MAQLGSIPEEVIYVYGDRKASIGFNFDELIEEGTQKTDVIPTFPVDADGNPNTLKRAIEWASNYSYYDAEKHRYMGGKSKAAEKRRKNKPFKGLRLLTLETRSEGGRAWKVIDKEGHYFDLREDVLLDTLTTVGTAEKGVLRGEFIWGKLGSQMRIVRTGSKLHDRLIEGTRLKNLNPLTREEIKPGGVYKTKSGKVQVCLGSPKGKHPYIYCQILQYRYHSSNSDPTDYAGRMMESLKNGWGHFSVVKSPTFIECVGGIDLPKNTMQRLREIYTGVGNTEMAKLLVQVKA